jgi:hypothetical protein
MMDVTLGHYSTKVLPPPLRPLVADVSGRCALPACRAEHTPAPLQVLPVVLGDDSPYFLLTGSNLATGEAEQPPEGYISAMVAGILFSEEELLSIASLRATYSSPSLTACCTRGG